MGRQPGPIPQRGRRGHTRSTLSFVVRERALGAETRVRVRVVEGPDPKASRQVGTLWEIYEIGKTNPFNQARQIYGKKPFRSTIYSIRPTHTAAGCSTNPRTTKTLTLKLLKHGLTAEWHPHEDEGGGEGEGEEAEEEAEGARRVEERVRDQRVSGCPCDDVGEKTAAAAATTLAPTRLQALLQLADPAAC